MHRYTFLAALAAALFFGAMGGNAATDPAFAGLNGGVVARIHFAGSAQVSGDPQAAKLNQLLAVPETADLREQTLQKLSTTPYRLLKSKISGQSTNDFTALIRPMLDDLLSSESYLEIRNSTNEVPELMLAVKVSDSRALMWQTNLSTIIETWTAIGVEAIQGEGYSGWQLKNHANPNLFRYIRAGNWVLFGWGQDELQLQPFFLQRIRASQRPAEILKGLWLDALLDLPAWAAHHPINLPIPLPYGLPKLHLTAEGKKDYVRPKLTMLFDKPLNLKLDPWKIPTSYIHNPIVSFAAVRGIGPWLSEIPEIKKLNPLFAPNQMTFWSMSNTLFECSAAALVPNAGNYLARLSPAILADFNGSLSSWPMFSAATRTNGRVKFAMPFISPYLTSMNEPAGDFVLGGLFPALPAPNAAPLPRDLIREIGSKSNMVCYSWEINSERMTQWQSLEQLYLLFSSKIGPSGDAPGAKWLQANRTNLSYCGTEITLTAPNELTLIRNAPLGLTSLELIGLEYWLDAPEFPLDANYQRRTPKPGARNP